MQFQTWPQEQPEPMDQEAFQARFCKTYPYASPEEVQAAWRDYRLWLIASWDLPRQLARLGPSHGQLN